MDNYEASTSLMEVGEIKGWQMADAQRGAVRSGRGGSGAVGIDRDRPPLAAGNGAGRSAAVPARAALDRARWRHRPLSGAPSVRRCPPQCSTSARSARCAAWRSNLPAPNPRAGRRCCESGRSTTWSELLGARAARAVRRARDGGARGGRRADPEPRHGRGQSVQRLAGGRRDGRRCWRSTPRSNSRASRARGRSRWRSSCAAFAAPTCAHDELLIAVRAPVRAPRTRSRLPQARTPALPGDLDRDGRGRRSRLDAQERISRVAVAVGACAPTAVRLRDARTARCSGSRAGEIGPRLATVVDDDALAPIAPIDDVRGTAAYRREAVRGARRAAHCQKVLFAMNDTPRRPIGRRSGHAHRQRPVAARWRVPPATRLSERAARRRSG